MRSFHICWWSFFTAFIMWFAIAPIQSEIQDTLNLSKQDLWTASIVGVSGTIFMRILLGPLCDKYGARTLMCIVLCIGSIPTACTGLINSAFDLAVLRLFIGIAGGSFVMCQFWISRMFIKEIVGTANGIVAGWGNLGGGVTQLFVGTVLFPLFKFIYNGNKEMAWRTCCIVPATIGFGSGILCYFVADDAPKGNYSEMKKYGILKEVSATSTFHRGAMNINSWIFFVQYATSFGVELTMFNAASLYFKDEFGQTTEGAAAIASVFGWMNVFARGLGGYFSDICNTYKGMKGRLLIQTIFLFGEGVMILVFVNTKTLGGSILCMIIFSLFVQAAEGSTFGIVPYIDPKATGAISGIVGSGGNVGAVGFSTCFRQMDYKPAFVIMGWIVLVSGFLSYFVAIEGQSGLNKRQQQYEGSVQLKPLVKRQGETKKKDTDAATDN
jgi:MFS transporter, NNP family, nitrate/nitrite transporter